MGVSFCIHGITDNGGFRQGQPGRLPRASHSRNLELKLGSHTYCCTGEPRTQTKAINAVLTKHYMLPGKAVHRTAYPNSMVSSYSHNTE